MNGMTGQGGALRQATAVREHVSIRAPELLQIRDGGALSYGAHQVWYPSWIQRMSGCGPTAASNQLWYLAATRPETCGPLFAGDGASRADMQRLMEAVWKYITPGLRGVDKASMLADGAVRYGADHGVGLTARVLEVSAEKGNRPAPEEIRDFLATAFADDLPVAFLNLSGGEVRGLDSWHWVTLVGVGSGPQAEMYDQGHRQVIDLALWLRTATNGGAFVVIEPV